MSFCANIHPEGHGGGTPCATHLSTKGVQASRALESIVSRKPAIQGLEALSPVEAASNDSDRGATA